MIRSKIQRTILSNCKFWQAGARYSQMRPGDLDNDLFNYHLQQLVKRGYLIRGKDLYKLTEKGKSIATNIDDQTGDLSLNYKVSVYLCPVIDGKVLLHRRLKHPQYGYAGLVSGKIAYGENILKTAEREFTEETNLKAKFKIIGNLRQIRKNVKGNVIEDGIFYVCFTDEIEGKLNEKHKEGEYFWVKVDKAAQIKKIFKPSLEVILDEAQKRLAGKISWDTKFIYEFEPEPEEY